MFNKRQLQVGWVPTDPTKPQSKTPTRDELLFKDARVRSHIQWAGKLALAGYAAKTAIDTASKIAIITAEKA